jgi:hypothetical protein
MPPTPQGAGRLTRLALAMACALLPWAASAQPYGYVLVVQHKNQTKELAYANLQTCLEDYRYADHWGLLPVLQITQAGFRTMSAANATSIGTLHTVGRVAVRFGHRCLTHLGQAGTCPVSCIRLHPPAVQPDGGEDIGPAQAVRAALAVQPEQPAQQPGADPAGGGQDGGVVRFRAAPQLPQPQHLEPGALLVHDDRKEGPREPEAEIPPLRLARRDEEAMAEEDIPGPPSVPTPPPMNELEWAAASLVPPGMNNVALVVAARRAAHAPPDIPSVLPPPPREIRVWAQPQPFVGIRIQFPRPADPVSR